MHPYKSHGASAYAAQMARRGAEYGVSLPGEVRMHTKKVKARKDAIQAPRSRRRGHAEDYPELHGLHRPRVL